MSTLNVNTITPATGSTVTVTSDLGVTSVNGGQLAGLRNKIINGNFDVWQRGTSFTGIASGAYTADRWATTLNLASGSVNVFRSATAVGDRSRSFYAAVTGASAVSATGAHGVQFTQRIEGVRNFAGKTITVSFRGLVDSGTHVVGIRAVQNFGTGGSPSALVSTYAATSLTLTTSEQAFSLQIDIPTIAGKTLGTNGDDYIQIGITLAANGTAAAFYAGGVAQDLGSKTVFLSQVQAEEGSVATPFEHRPYGMELALCQRYYYRATPDLNSPFGVGFIVSTTLVYITIPFPAVMRISPTAIEQNGTASNYRVRWSAGATTCSSVVTFANGSPSAGFAIFTVASGLTAGQAVFGETNLAGAYLGWSAEL